MAVDEAWPGIQEEIARAAVPVRQLAGDPAQGSDCLRRLGVTTRSCLGAMAYHSGRLLVDGGWLRVYGGTSGELPSLIEVNAATGAGFVVAHDVLGGVFAINGPEPDGRPGGPGEMTYFAPDSLCWEALGVGHSAWLSWLLTDQLALFYKALRWPGWQRDTEALASHEGFSVYPFLWTEEAQQDIAATSRSRVPLGELLGLHTDLGAQLGLPAPGPLGVLR